MSPDNSTFTDILLGMKARGDAPCFSFIPEGEVAPTETIEYRQVYDRACRFAAAFIANGLVKGDRVAMFAHPTPNYLSAYLGTILAGGVVAPINHNFHSAELGAYLAYIEPRFMICDTAGRPMVEAVQALQNCQWQAFVIDGGDGGTLQHLDWADWQPVEPSRALPDDLALIVHTSGTTALPKGVERTQKSMRAFIDNWIGFAWREGDTLLSYLPFYHQSGSLTSIFPMLAVGGHTIQLQHFSASRFWEVVHNTRPNIASLIPPVPTYLLLQPQTEKDRDHTLEWAVIGGRTDHWSDFQDRFGIACHSPYGSTETTYVTISGNRDMPGPSRKELMDARPHYYAGPIIPNYLDMRIMGPEGPVGPGVEGEIQIRGPGVFERYFRLPEKTAEVFDGDWFKSGDMGYLRDDGFLFMIDRAKDVIRRSSENISPQEIELAMSEHEAVGECVAVGAPDPIRGQEILVCIRLKPDCTATPEELFVHCAGRLSPFKVPRFLELWDRDFPRTGTLKVCKENLREPTPGITRHDRSMIKAPQPTS